MKLQIYGCFLKWWYPHFTPQNDQFVVGKPVVVGETHHLRKPPYVRSSLSIVWWVSISIRILSKFLELPWEVKLQNKAPEPTQDESGAPNGKLLGVLKNQQEGHENEKKGIRTAVAWKFLCLFELEQVQIIYLVDIVLSFVAVYKHTIFSYHFIFFQSLYLCSYYIEFWCWATSWHWNMVQMFGVTWSGILLMVRKSG